MDREESIRAAKEAIGEGQPDDYVIAPSKHANLLQPKAPALAKILQKGQFSTIIEDYERKDAEAKDEQAIFKKTANRANWAVFLTACLSAALLITGPLATAGSGKFLLIVLGCSGIFSGALGAMWLFRVRAGKMLENWTTSRSAAEMLRLKYFELVTQAKEMGQNSSIPLPLLQLEYFRRYQLDVQRAYYKNRRNDHKRAADKMLQVSAGAVALGSVATGLAGLLGGAVNTAWVSIAGLGAVASALSAFASTNEALGQDRRNEERYRKTQDALSDLAGKLEDVRESAAEGAREPLQQFVTAVHEQCSLEHRQWIGAADSTEASLAQLEITLADARSKLLKPESSRPSRAAEREQRGA